VCPLGGCSPARAGALCLSARAATRHIWWMMSSNTHNSRRWGHPSPPRSMDAAADLSAHTRAPHVFGFARLRLSQNTPAGAAARQSVGSAVHRVWAPPRCVGSSAGRSRLATGSWLGLLLLLATAHAASSTAAPHVSATQSHHSAREDPSRPAISISSPRRRRRRRRRRHVV
jgi:hypothetical protein